MELEPFTPSRPSSRVRPPRNRLGCGAVVGVALGLVVGIGGGFAWLRMQRGAGRTQQRLLLPPPEPIVARGELADFERTTVRIFGERSPSVVYITRLENRAADPFGLDVRQIPSGTGSGFIWDTSGHIVTNNHVIDGGSGAYVTLADRSTWPAQRVGVAPSKDIAVLRINAPAAQLRAMPIGESRDLQVGQSVFAIGNPFGFDHTLSTGVISGLDRVLSGGAQQRPITGMIQTDAAINPGNSGGPLLDSAGRVVGMNTAIYSPSGAYAGIGFAIPVDMLRRIVPQIITNGRAVRPGLGVVLAQTRVAEGALILSVNRGSPAEQAALRPTTRDPRTGAIVLGDVIVALAGNVVRAPDDVYRELDRHDVGQEVVVAVMRGNARVEVNVRLAAFADE